MDLHLLIYMHACMHAYTHTCKSYVKLLLLWFMAKTCQNSTWAIAEFVWNLDGCVEVMRSLYNHDFMIHSRGLNFKWVDYCTYFFGCQDIYGQKVSGISTVLKSFNHRPVFNPAIIIQSDFRLKMGCHSFVWPGRSASSWSRSAWFKCGDLKISAGDGLCLWVCQFMCNDK